TKVPFAPSDLLVALEVGAVSVISPTRVLDLVDYSSSSDSDPSKDSLPVSEPTEQRPERHESLAPSSKFPLAPIVAPLEIRRRPAILVQPGEAIPFGRPYCTHPNGPCKLLTVRKRVGPFPALSSLELIHPDTSQVILYIHCQTHHQFILQDAMHQRSAPLSILYPPTTSESSLDSSSERSLDSSLPFAGPSRKRYRDVTDLGNSYGAGAHTKVDSGIFEPTGGDAPDLEGTLYDIAHYMSEVPFDRITKNIGHGNGNDEGGNGNGNGNGNGGENGNGNHNENDRDARHVVRECTYQDFMKCQPLNFKGAEGVVKLIRGFEKMQTVFHITNCLEKYQVKYATCTLLNSALTWWNSHKRTIGTDVAFVVSCRELMKLMAEN
ncbi:hypothetical protein Tco_1205236, partial [Tanacetum coccineum]